MRVSRKQVAENRRKILEVAGELFRERGVAEIMQAAGLTHGGFYGYFRSKDELIAAALEDALARPAGPLSDLLDYAANYLTRGHRDDPACGCSIAALAGETRRQTDAVRAKVTAGLRRRIDRLSRVAPGKDADEKRQAAIGSWAAMVGAMVMARASSDEALSGELLDESRAGVTIPPGNSIR